MLTRSEKFKLKQEFPEGIPPWMFDRGYDVNKIRQLMQGRRVVFTPPGKDDPIPPEHHFMVDADKWSDAVFGNADHFTVVVGRSPFNRTRQEFKSYPEAMERAHNYEITDPNGGRPMIYAVAASGRSTMLVPQKWNWYLDLWNKKVETGK